MNIQRTLNDGICTLAFDRPDSSANIFDQAALEELNAHLDWIEGNQAQVRGVVFISAKDSIFIAGADIKSLQSAGAQELRQFIAGGQRTFNRVAALAGRGVYTVAAIHGACMGGGYELTLACAYRIASSDKATKIGLPEVMLGILPAWGGSTRLPRLIGVPKALDIILAGKTPSASSARKLGMVDEVVPRAALMDAARNAIARQARSRQASLALNLILAPLSAPLARRAVMKKTRGHYPAPLAALSVVAGAPFARMEDSLARELEEEVRLADTEACRNLMRLFLMTEKAKKESGARVSPPANPPGPAQTCAGGDTRAPAPLAAVIGAGVMGAGITQWLAAKGWRVVLRDLDAQKVGAGMGRIEKLLSDRRAFREKEARDAWDRIVPAPAPIPLLAQCDLVIEAAVEKMALKKKIFAELDGQTKAHAVLATNTSALSITELSEAVRDPGRVVGIHFFNPVHKMQLVEVVVGRHTRPEVAAKAQMLVRRMGKLPVVVKDSPGFLVNRILMPYMLEAARFFDQGAAVADIDEAMLEFGMPMGPLRLMDEVGLDVAQDVAETLGAAFGDRMKVPAAIAPMLKAGLLGKKAGKGFYLHGAKGSKPNAGVRFFASGFGMAAFTREQMRERMALLMVNEAARCLEEGIVASAEEADFAMVMGTGFAPFRGGPLRFADAFGIARCAVRLKEVSPREPHYAPCALLEKMAEEKTTFY